MFKIEHKGIIQRRSRLVSSTKLAESDFEAVAAQMGHRPFKARKIAYVAARRAEKACNIETFWNGKESTNSAAVGDWIVTNLSAQREVLRDAAGHENTYVIDADSFSRIYESETGANEFGRFYKAKTLVEAIYLAGGFDILAPWGQKQTADVGYLLRNGPDIYGNHATTFDATYEVVH